MQRPDLATLSCINVECQYFGRPHQGNLAIRKVYGKDRIRLLRCRKCREEFSERRNHGMPFTSDGFPGAFLLILK